MSDELKREPTAQEMAATIAALGDVDHWAVRLLVEGLAKSLGDAPNFVCLTFEHATVGRILATVQRRDGKSPVEVCLDLRNQLEGAKSLVRDMRAAQKRYFTCRTVKALHEAKDLEKRVDQMVGER